MTDAELEHKAGRLRRFLGQFPDWHPWWELIKETEKTLWGGPSAMPRIRLEAALSDIVADHAYTVERRA